VFTARYALSPYINQTRLFFKRLKKFGLLSYRSITANLNLLNACNKDRYRRILGYWSCILDCILGRLNFTCLPECFFIFS
jgi:hypothetical protein